MNCYILVDFGSTYTKLTLVDIDRQCIIGKSSSHTTVNTNIKIGYEKALKKIKDKIDFNDVNIINILACSSAAGGLKMVVIGVTPTFTVEAAKMAILGAGARLLKSYNYFLKNKDIIEIDNLKPDIILLTGGTEGGNTEYITHNARLLKNLKSNIPIVVAGNSYASEEINEIFKDSKIDFRMTENLMPDTSRINPNPVREVIREIFMSQIIFAKGMEDISKIVNEVLMPTPTAVLKAAKLLSEGTNKYKGWGDLMIIDIGGATTDVHSISEPIKQKIFLDGLEEPYDKRTVEGDLGMRYSALSVYECVGEENFLKHNCLIKNIDKKCKFRSDNPDLIFEETEEIEFDEIIAKNCIEISTKRHSGKVRYSYISGRSVLVQSGKDLRDINFVIGTGGVIVNSKNTYEILKEVISKDDEYLLPKKPKFKVDKEYILSAMGILSIKDKNLAFKILTENVIDVNR